MPATNRLSYGTVLKSCVALYLEKEQITLYLLRILPPKLAMNIFWFEQHVYTSSGMVNEFDV
jgi:hypothetical protein